MSLIRFVIELDQVGQFFFSIFFSKVFIIRFPFYENGMLSIFSIKKFFAQNFFKKEFMRVQMSLN